jgi:NAD-dependent dihydropyrimidine dehydrogenase PreA subunit
MPQKPDRGRIEIKADECKGCMLCVSVCPTDCIDIAGHLNKQGYKPAVYKGEGCTGCGFCYYACPEPGAVTVFRIKKTA